MYRDELGSVSNLQRYEQLKIIRNIVMGDVPGNDAKRIWNGGKTNVSNKITKEEAMIFRQMEDSYDLDDSEIEFRSELVEREKMMREEAKQQQIQSKYSLSKRPLHELYMDIDYEKKTNVSGMGGKGGPVEAMRSKSGESK